MLVDLFASGKELDYFARLRREDPVHLASNEHGPYWSITKYHDIVAIDRDSETFSSQPAITISDPDPSFPLSMFIAKDEPEHRTVRSRLEPSFARPALAELAVSIHEVVNRLYDSLPVDRVFDWHAISKEIAISNLATLLGLPQEDRGRLAVWSEALVASEAGDQSGVHHLIDCSNYLRAHTSGIMGKLGQSVMERLGNALTLIVGGKDTVSNALSGSIVALDGRQPDPTNLKAFVAEAIRWQSPAPYMRRTARKATEIRGRTIAAGDKVVMWYVSGNRDEEVFERADELWPERPDVRRHLAFGSGAHRCIGSLYAEMQLEIAWAELMKRYTVRLAGTPLRTRSAFTRGYQSVPVILNRP